MFERGSRYEDAETFEVTDATGRVVRVVAPPDLAPETLRGYHQQRQGQRLDLLAAHYLDDPTAFWRICALNDVMLAESLSLEPELAIPNPRR